MGVAERLFMFSVKCASAYFFFAAYSSSFALKYFILHCIIFAAHSSRVKACGFNLSLHLVLWLHRDAVIVPYRTVAETLLPLVECQESGNMCTECKGTAHRRLNLIGFFSSPLLEATFWLSPLIVAELCLQSRLRGSHG